MQLMGFVNISDDLWSMLRAIRKAGGTPMVVGGAVRDAVLRSLFPQEFGDLESKDIDIEIFGLPRNEVAAILSRFGKVSDVGQSFETILVVVNGEKFDFTLPRRDSKVGRGNKGFDVVVDHTMTPAEAASRRDFTMNSVGLNPFTGELVDPFNGVQDLRDRVLQPTSKHFDEDPLRILRGFQFVSRFNLRWTGEIIESGRRLVSEFDSLPQERIREEWLKWALKSVSPSQGIEFLRQVDWLQFFPEIEALDGCPQDALWHKEGNVLEHTGEVVDAMAWQCERDGVGGETRVRRMFGALCHDFGKATNTWLQPKNYNQRLVDEALKINQKDEGFWKDVNVSVEDRKHWNQIVGRSEADVQQFQQDNWDQEWRWRSPAHDSAGEQPTRTFMNRLFKARGQKASNPLIESVVAMVVTHMRHIVPEVSERMVKRLSAKVNIMDMQAVVNADSNGRPFSPETWESNPMMDRIVEVATELSVREEPPTPILRGRDLIRVFRWKGGPRFKIVLDAAFEAQLDGLFDTLDGAIEFVQTEGLV